MKLSTPPDAHMTRPLLWPDNIRKKTVERLKTSDAILCPLSVPIRMLWRKLLKAVFVAANRSLIEFLSSSVLLGVKCNFCALPELFS